MINTEEVQEEGAVDLVGHETIEILGAREHNLKEYQRNFSQEQTHRDHGDKR